MELTMSKIKHSFYAASAMALMGAASFGSVSTAYADTSALQSVEKAQSPADHAAIAKRYEKEAADYEKQATEHEQLAAKYRKMPSNPKLNLNATELAAHCDRQAKRMKEAAAEAREMAQMHGDVAKLTSK
jgi:hypothetical protein